MPEARPIVKIASDDWEFDAIHRLNHRTFAEEIPQHGPTDTKRIVDRFHRENTYVIAVHGDAIAGMIAVRATRPFSLDRKLRNLDTYLPAGRHVCELRLLAVEHAHRSTAILPDLLGETWRHIVERGYDLAVISAYLGQLKLYQHLGFEAFGPLVGARPDVQFQPMMLTLERFAYEGPKLARRMRRAHERLGSFLPGPVTVHADVSRAFAAAPQSHRSHAFRMDFDAVRRSLSRFTRAKHVQILLGSGTLANDVIAGQLGLQRGAGLILVNGEFGERLVDHARRARLQFGVMACPWGQALDLEIVRTRLGVRPLQWLWCVHCETSTGLLNDLAGITRLCRNAGVRLAVDAVSSLGTTPVDLESVFLASGTSGKGLGAFPGLSFVFHDHQPDAAPDRLPRLLDLGLYAADGVPFTHSSNLVAALAAALEQATQPDRPIRMAEHAQWLRTRLTRLGFDIVGRDGPPAPGVITIAIPHDLRSVDVASELHARGAEVGAFSRYLTERNWIQIALMGADLSRSTLSVLSIMLADTCRTLRERQPEVPRHRGTRTPRTRPEML